MNTTDNVIQFEEFAKIPRLRREIVVTEKIDGTNAQVLVIDVEAGADYPAGIAVSTTEKYTRVLCAGSRNRWLQPGKSTDNFGFAGWVKDNADQLAQLGPGRHYGEWWGQGIQRTYGLDHKRFSLFNAGRWIERKDYESDKGGLRKTFPKIQPCPDCCHVVPMLANGPGFEFAEAALVGLKEFGSFAAPGFMDPEGIIVFHTAANALFKQTIEKDEEPKSLAKAA